MSMADAKSLIWQWIYMTRVYPQHFISKDQALALLQNNKAMALLRNNSQAREQTSTKGSMT
jgi:hypothetical protein